MTNRSDSTDEYGDMWRCPHCAKMNTTQLYHDGDGAQEYAQCRHCELFSLVACSVSISLSAAPIPKADTDQAHKSLGIMSDEEQLQFDKSIDGWVDPVTIPYVDPDQQSIPFVG
jgi:transcription elongation factor Elf1